MLISSSSVMPRDIQVRSTLLEGMSNPLTNTFPQVVDKKSSALTSAAIGSVTYLRASCPHNLLTRLQGAHYKFGVNVSTTGFADAPTEILRSVSQLSWAQERAIDTVKEKFEEDRIDYCAESMSLKSEAFNELLSLGYFESSVINVRAQMRFHCLFVNSLTVP